MNPGPPSLNDEIAPLCLVGEAGERQNKKGGLKMKDDWEICQSCGHDRQDHDHKLADEPCRFCECPKFTGNDAG